MTQDSAIVIVDIRPQKQVISRFSRTASLELTVANPGSRAAPLRLSASDTRQSCVFEFRPPGESTYLTGQTSLNLAAGQIFTVPVRVTLPPRRVIGLSRRHHLELTCAPLAWPGAPQAVAAQVVTRPLLGPWLLGLLAILLLAGASWLAPHFLPAAAPIANTPVKDNVDALTAPPAMSVNPGFGMDPGYQPPPRPATVAKNPAEMSYDEMFETVAAEYNLEPRLLAELAYQESRMNPLALGRDNDMGLMQVIPATWNHWQPQAGVTNGPFDPYSNIRVGAAYLAFVRDHVRAKGYGYQQPYETLWMLVGYNWGTSNLDKIFNSNGGWAQVPPRQQTYALNIWWAAQSTTPRWQINQP